MFTSYTLSVANEDELVLETLQIILLSVRFAYYLENDLLPNANFASLFFSQNYSDVLFEPYFATRLTRRMARDTHMYNVYVVLLTAVWILNSREYWIRDFPRKFKCRE